MSASKEDVEKMIQGETSLDKHVSRFSRSGFFGPATVASGLTKIHSSRPGLKGFAIAAFNSGHAGNLCPFFTTAFKADETIGFAKFLHLGTTRIWNKDGSVNEERWTQFVDFVTEGQEFREQKFATKRAVLNYLQHCYETHPQESDTARNTSSFLSFSTIQVTAAQKAWDEVYDRLTCGWIYDVTAQDYDCYIHLDLARLFFDDSTAAFQQAETKALPVAKPAMAHDMRATAQLL